MGKLKINHLPVFVSVEPANRCNLHCPECPVGNGSVSSKLNLLDNIDFIRDISSSLLVVQFYFQGEPLLNKKLPELIHVAHGLKLYTIVSTNAQLLDEEWAEKLVASGLNRIIVSIDGFTQESYSQYRIGGDLLKAKRALGFLNAEKHRQKSDIEIVLQCLRLKTNEHEWGLLKENYKKWGATKLEFKTAQFDDYYKGNPLMPTNEKYSRYVRQKDGIYRRKKQYSNYCYRLWSGCVVNASGEVLPCCFCKDSSIVFGNVNDAKISDIWKAESAMCFRKKILKNRKIVKMCENCTE